MSANYMKKNCEIPFYPENTWCSSVGIPVPFLKPCIYEIRIRSSNVESITVNSVTRFAYVFDI
jgi:hypothetical protein